MNILKVQLGELFDDNLPINETTEIVLRELIGDKKRTDHLIEHFTHPLQRVNGAIIMPSSTDNTKYDFGKLGKLNIRIHPQLLKKIDVENQWRDELAIHRNQVAMYQSLFAFSASQVNQIQTGKD